MRPNAAKILLAVALAATLQWARTPVFATPRARSGQMIRRRVGDELSRVFYGMQDPNFQAAVASAWAFVETNLKPAANLAKSLQQVREFAKTWGERTPFEGKDADKHVKELTGAIEKTIAAGENVLIPTAQEADLPLEPIRGTPFEKLMVATLQNISMVGVYALHAEPGAGKSTAATLAALELKGRQPKDVIVVLQNDFERQVESFFCLSNIKFTAEIARPFLAMLREKGIRLRLILDNVLDDGVLNQGDVIRALARAANDNLHQVIFIVQSEAAAAEIGGVNGDTTRQGYQMPAVWYRWSREETLELLNRTSNIQELLEKRLRDDGEAEERNVLLAEALEHSEVPDKYGRWRPRSTKRYIMTGDRPTAPLPIPGTTALTKPVWVCQLEKDDEKFEQIGNPFKVTGELADVDDLKEAIKKKKPNTVRCDADEINVYSQKDRSWIKEEKMSASLRNTDESDCYGFMIPSA